MGRATYAHHMSRAIGAQHGGATVTGVLHVTTIRAWRGGERQVLHLARGLAARGVPQALAAPAGSELAERARNLALPVVPLHPQWSRHPTNLLRLVRHLAAHRATLLHAHSSHALTLAIWARRLAPAAGLVYTRHVGFPVRRARKYRRGADRYIAVSQQVAGLLIAAGAPAARTVVIHGGVDAAEFDAAAPCGDLPALAGGPTVGCVAQMTAEKGHAVLAAAWPLVAGRVQRARLVLVGDGPEAARLHGSFSRAGGPAGVVWAGYREDVPAWLKRFDLYVQPSLHEGLPTAVLEAMACSLPVVATRVGGLPEAVEHGVTGLLVPPGDPARLAQAIVELLTEPERASQMGAAGRRRVLEQFSVRRMVEAHLDLLSEFRRASREP